MSRLGTDALASVALVFLGFMMIQMFSAGAIGGSVASAVARALGAGRRDDARGLVLNPNLCPCGRRVERDLRGRGRQSSHLSMRGIGIPFTLSLSCIRINEGFGSLFAVVDRLLRGR